MKQFWLLVFVSVSFMSISSQQVKHAPTVEQCRADEKLWSSKLEQPEGAGTANVSYKELGDWWREMHYCRKVDPDNDGRYRDTQSEVIVSQWVRLIRFIHRHNLWDEFIAEDEQGKR